MGELLPYRKAQSNSDDKLIMGLKQGRVSIFEETKVNRVSINKKHANRLIMSHIFYKKVDTIRGITLQKRFFVLTPKTLLIYSNQEIYNKKPYNVIFVIPLNSIDYLQMTSLEVPNG